MSPYDQTQQNRNTRAKGSQSFHDLPPGKDEEPPSACRTWLRNLRPRVLEDVESPLDPIGDVNQPVAVDEKIVEHGGLLAFGRRRNEEADLLGTIRISQVHNPQPGVIIGNEDEVFAVDRAGPVLVDVMRSEAQTPLAEISLGHRKRADRYRISLLAYVDDPDPFLPLLTFVFHRLIGRHHEFPPRKGQSRVRIPAVGRPPVEAADELWRAGFGKIEDR